MQSTNPRNPTSTPRRNVGHTNKNSVPQGADTQQDGRASPYDPDRSVENHLRGQAAGSDNQTQGAQAPTTNTNNTNNQIQFQNTQRCVPQYNWSHRANMTTDIHSLPTRDQVRRLPVILINSLLFQIFSHEPGAYPQSRKPRDRSPKVVLHSLW